MGSSPRVRGKRRRPGGGFLRRGLIPACAGKTRRRGDADPDRWAHPRVCGENQAVRYESTYRQGSSPRVRGKRNIQFSDFRYYRLIPACAGKTGCQAARNRIGPAHPRVCGENDQRLPSVLLIPGSSPRVRGKLRGRVNICDCERLIPACAGKTDKPQQTTSLQWAHPRVCGENTRLLPFAKSPLGSSPRVRGKRFHSTVFKNRPRLIPACAGKTYSIHRRRRRSGAHPRVCGENATPKPRSNSVPGSSPRVRGKRYDFSTSPHFSGLIPACAGKTVSTRSVTTPIGAHPRVCGENKVVSGDAWPRTGSSPRVRGKRGHWCLLSHVSGLIPACAGKTESCCLLCHLMVAHPRVCGENGLAKSHANRF